MALRVGIGYDIHRVQEGRPLVLGGVKFDSVWGLEGHSDADVLCHAIGGVPPLAHRQQLETFLDLDLMGLDEIWAAAGHPNALFRVTPDELLQMSNARIVSVT